MNRFAFIAIALVLCGGCSSPRSLSSEKNAGASEDEEVVVLSFQGPRLPRHELRELKRRAAKADGEAAFRLYAYYAFSVEADGPRSQSYFDLAVKLEYPMALYQAALREWSQQRKPDIDRVEHLLRRAEELGYQDQRHLLDEVVEARKTGIIPARSPTRLFVGSE